MELANASVQLGQLLLNARKAAEAVPYIARSVDALEQLSALDPRNLLYRRNLAVVETQYAAALRLSGDFNAALQHNRKSLNVAEALSKAVPNSLEYRADVGIDHRKLAETLLAARDAPAAFEHSSRAAAILCEIARTSSDAYLQANCGRAFLFMGHAQLGLNQSASAVESYRRAEQIAAKLSQADPLDAILRSDLARTESSLAAGLARVHRYAEAKDSYRLAMDNWSKLRNQNTLTAEDAKRAEDTARGLASIETPSSRP